MILSSNAATDAGTESGAASELTLPNFGCGCPACRLLPTAPGIVSPEGDNTVLPGLAGLDSGNEIEPPDWVTAISSSREVAASSLTISVRNGLLGDREEGYRPFDDRGERVEALAAHLWLWTELRW